MLLSFASLEPTALAVFSAVLVWSWWEGFMFVGMCFCPFSSSLSWRVFCFNIFIMIFNVFDDPFMPLARKERKKDDFRILGDLSHALIWVYTVVSSVLRSMIWFVLHLWSIFYCSLPRKHSGLRRSWQRSRSRIAPFRTGSGCELITPSGISPAL